MKAPPRGHIEATTDAAPAARRLPSSRGSARDEGCRAEVRSIVIRLVSRPLRDIGMVSKSARVNSWFGPTGRALAAVLAWAVLGSAAHSQEWRLLWGTAPTPPANSVDELGLRPNAQ